MPNWLLKRAEVAGDRPAVMWKGREISFGELSTAVDILAQRLVGLGLRSGARAGLLMSPGLRFVEVMHAVTRCGGTVVPLNTRLLAVNLGEQLTVARATCVLYDEGSRELVEGIVTQGAGQDSHPVNVGGGVFLRRLSSPGSHPDAPTPVHEVPASAGSEKSSAAWLRDEVVLSDMHSIVFSSGTTGAGKAVELTHGNHWWNAIGSMLNLGHFESDRWLLCLPHYHVGGLSILLRSVIYGAPVVIQPGFDPDAVNDALDNDGITIVSVVSTMLRRMLEARSYRPYPDALRCVLLGGGPIPRSLLEQSLAAGIPVAPTYGLTETASQVATLHPRDVRQRIGAAGRALFPVQLAIERGGERAAPGETGEIVVRGPSVSASYSGVDADDRHRNGWFYTGDAGSLDEQRYLYVLDRQDDMIVSGGENIYPSEVEAVLTGHPDVLDAGVFGVPDDEWGQAVVAAIVPRPGRELTTLGIKEYCRDRLSRFKIPKEVLIVEGLPRTASGKLRRNVVREAYSGRAVGNP